MLFRYHLLRNQRELFRTATVKERQEAFLSSPLVRTGLGLSLGLLLTTAIATAQQRNFVSCPIVRDTKTVPCFLAEYDGELYYLGIQQDITSDFHPPQLKHEVLVEGRVAPGPRICGGIPLQPVSVSVIKEVNLACNTLLPPEPGIDAPDAPRGAGPSSRPLDLERAPSAPLTGAHEFTLLYSFNDDYLQFTANAVVNQAAAYSQKIGASKVKVSGYRATSVLSNGNRLVEKAGLAEKRAQNIATLLRGLGVSNVAAEWKQDAEAGDGQADASHRRVTILVTP
jgi:outer membrane protein OmpA-like peptidoglycan-associated protein